MTRLSPPKVYMAYFIIFVLLLAVVAAVVFIVIRERENRTRLTRIQDDLKQAVEKSAHLQRFEHIPDIIEKSKRVKAEVESRIRHANQQADEIIRKAGQEATELISTTRSRDQASEFKANLKRSDLLEQAKADARLIREKANEEAGELRARQLVTQAREQARDIIAVSQKEAETIRAEARRLAWVATGQSQAAMEEAQKEAKDLASKARKDAKEKREKIEYVLTQATYYALEIREKAERRAEEIAGEAFKAKGKLRDYEASAQAFKNMIEKYEGTYIVPPTHVLDELAREFGFDDAGTRLRLARQRTSLMNENGTAATCGYPDGWKKDHALKFVLGTFNGRVDTILARLKPDKQGKLIQEIKDAYALVNLDGEVYKNARIHEEYLDARLEEVKWGAAVLKIKERVRDEQRAIKEQIREEQRARQEMEKAIRQAEREEELVNKAIARIRQQFEAASGAERARLEAQLQEMNVKLAEAEEKSRRTISRAEQFKDGHVYIISNLGSFGKDVYKIGLTRRLDPKERVSELSNASVPFPFDVHAMLRSDDAPALETTLHRKFVEKQVNKVNRRKEFFKVSLKELRDAIDELGIDCTWTMEYEASQYRETQDLEEAMRSNAGVRKQWLDQQATFRFDADDFEDAEQEYEEAEA